MSTKKHLAYALAFVALNIAASFIHSGDGRALRADRYEDASEADIAAALADAPIVCVAADTTSGCG